MKQKQNYLRRILPLNHMCMNPVRYHKVNSHCVMFFIDLRYLKMALRTHDTQPKGKNKTDVFYEYFVFRMYMLRDNSHYWLCLEDA
jgi:hypothetical protein